VVGALLRDADRRTSSPTASQVRRLDVSNGGGELGALQAERCFVLEEIDLICWNCWILPAAESELKRQLNERNATKRRR
jgi:hypothetical protein